MVRVLNIVPNEPLQKYRRAAQVAVLAQRAVVRLNEKKMQSQKFFQNPLLGYPWSH